ncbi:MAG: PmoA family protein [Planctomicrobium sp.]|nr:PmoA family protein [Planctomicrobium sp.]
MPQQPRCEVIPLPGHQVSFRVDGGEVTRWHYGSEYPRPFFFPFNGPSGETLTRMGHPDASNHDHHRSVWFAHHKVLGINFWGDGNDAFIRQKMWFEYRDGEEECAMAVQLDWHDGHDPQPLLEQEVIATLRPLEDGEWTLDLQSTFRPKSAELEFEQSNFGFLAVRVAKSLSGHFGEGTITGASGEVGEKNLFGIENRWMDYSGPILTVDAQGETVSVTNGITYFDHPANPNFPAKWHVREDGWMGASACRDSALLTTRLEPLRLRYLLHVHESGINPQRAEELFTAWKQRPMQTVQKGSKPHMQFEIAEL